MQRLVAVELYCFYSVTKLAVAWYRPEQWAMLRALSADPQVLENTYAEWLAIANRSVEDLEKLGAQVEKVNVDVAELATWCEQQKRLLDSTARAEFAAQKADELAELHADFERVMKKVPNVAPQPGDELPD